MKKNELSLTAAAETFNKLQTGADTPATFDEAFALLESAPEAALSELSSDYFKFTEKNKPYSFLFTGFSDFVKDGKTVKVVKLVTKEGEGLINGDVVLVGACEKLTTVPAYIRVTYLNDVGPVGKQYKNLSVKTFPIS